MTTPVNSSTMGLRLAQAYGTGAAPGARPVAKSSPLAPAASVQALRSADRVDIAARVGPGNAQQRSEKLVAAVVPGRVDFTVGETRAAAQTSVTKPNAQSPAATAPPTAGPLPFYRAPSDRNAAATAIMIGRSVDVAG